MNRGKRTHLSRCSSHHRSSSLPFSLSSTITSEEGSPTLFLLFQRNSHGSSSSGSPVHCRRTVMLIPPILIFLRRHQPPTPPGSFSITFYAVAGVSAVAAP
ncbi:hypothetical protein LXL04_037930 [Taraxacum kok-saghyz]